MDVTSSRASSRPALPRNVAWTLQGVDGSQQGGLRPINGFRQLHQIQRPDQADATWTEHSSASIFLDFWPISFHIGSTQYGYGVAYAVKRTSGGLVDVFIDFWQNDTSTLIRAKRIAAAKPNDEMSVVCMGRFIFCFVRGATPTMSYWDATSNAIVTVATPGPGTEPTLVIGGASNSRVNLTDAAGSWADLEPGAYSFAYGFLDTRTGRRGPISKIATTTEDDFPTGDPTTKATLTVTGVDGSKWDRVVVYRSPAILTVGDAYASGVLFVDQIYTLSDLVSTNQTLTIVYALEDKALVLQEAFTQRDQFDASMPYGGAAMAYQGSLVVSRISGSPAPAGDNTDSLLQSNIGELRWSSTLKVMPEHFSPFSRFTTRVPANEMVSLVDVGEYAFGFSKDRVYHMRKTPGTLRVIELHQGYGILNRNAACAVGGMVYFATATGLKAIAGNGQLDDVAALDDDLIRRWASSRSELSLSFDAESLALMILNPTAEECRVLWMGSYRVTQIGDTPFFRTRSGWWSTGFWLGASSPDYTTSLVQKALFLHRKASGGWANSVTQDVLCLDTERLKVPTMTTLDLGRTIDGLTIRTVGTRGGPATTLELTTAPPATIAGAKVYALNGSLVGQSWLVSSVSGNNLILSTSNAMLAGEKVGLSPVPFEWVGSNIHRAVEETGVGEVQDLFQNKQLSTIGAVFSSIVDDADDSTEALKTFLGGVYKGTEDSVTVESVVLDRSGAQAEGVIDSAGPLYARPRQFTQAGGSLSPSIRIVCPELDFRLLAVIVRGKVTESDRNSLPE